MRIIDLNNILSGTLTNEEGYVLLNQLEDAKENNSKVIIEFDSNKSISSSFLNTSFGIYIEKYGLESFREDVKVKGSKTQFDILKKYVDTYGQRCIC